MPAVDAVKGGTGLVALVALAEARVEFVVGGAVVAVVEGMGGVEDGEEEESLFGRDEEDCCLRRRGSFDMLRKSEFFC